MVDGTISKDLVRQLFTSAELPRIPFVPLVFSHAAMLEQIGLDEAFSNPTQLTKIILNAQKLYGYDAVINNFDLTLEAEACGCSIRWGSDYELPHVSNHPLADVEQVSNVNVLDIERTGRLPVVLETTRRLKMLLGRTIALVVVVTGPLTLSSHLRGDVILKELDERTEEAIRIIELAGQVSTKVCRLYCELEPDIVLIVEDRMPEFLPKHLPLLTSLYRPIWNTARFYNAFPVLLKRGYPINELEAILQLGMDGVVFGDQLTFEDLDRIALKYNCSIGASIPLTMLSGSQKGLHEFVNRSLERGARRRFFLTTEWEIPPDVPAVNIHLVMRALSSS